jgi:ribosomal protein L44E
MKDRQKKEFSEALAQSERRLKDKAEAIKNDHKLKAKAEAKSDNKVA